MNAHKSYLIHSHGPRRADGVALVVALVFLLMLTMLGVASLSGNTAQERMTYAFGNYTRAFQAADASVKQGEYWVSSQTAPPLGGEALAGTTATLLTAPDNSGTTTSATAASLLSSSWWSSNGLNFATNYTQNGGSSSSRSYAGLLRVNSASSANAPPQYTIEYMGPNSNVQSLVHTPTKWQVYYYRITGRSGGDTGATSATVQSVWSQPW